MIMNKIIFSRKGFDTNCGRIPSLIIGKQMIILPIPEKEPCINRDGFTDKKYGEIEIKINETGESITLKDLILAACGRDTKAIGNGVALGRDVDGYCHLDPQVLNYFHDPSFVASLGQEGRPYDILAKYNVGKGDIFLFFGNFAKADSKTYRLTQNGFSHYLWGYMQIGGVFLNPSHYDCRIPEYIRNANPHCYYSSTPNCVYAAAEKLSDAFCPDGFEGTVRGYGVFDYSDNLLLSSEENCKELKKRNSWPILQNPDGSFIKIGRRNMEMINVRGQEFVYEPEKDNDRIMAFLKNILKEQLKNEQSSLRV